MAAFTKFPFRRWAEFVQLVCSDKVRKATIEEVEALLVRGEELKKKGKVSNFDTWNHRMLMLKKKKRDLGLTSQASNCFHCPVSQFSEARAKINGKD